MKILQCFILLCVWHLSSDALLAQSKTQAKLLLSAETARPGDNIWAAVQLKMPPGWHTYWKNAGDSGSATKIVWELPKGITAGEILWPIPAKSVEDEFTTYIYKDEVLLLVPLSVDPIFGEETAEIKATVSWLECEKVCLPGSAPVQTLLHLGPENKPSSDASLIEAWRKKLPSKPEPLPAGAHWVANGTEEGRPFVIEWEVGREGIAADFFPFRGEGYQILGATESLPGASGKVSLRKILKLEDQTNWPKQIAGLLVAQLGGSGKQEAIEASLVVEEQKQASQPPAAVRNNPAAAIKPSQSLAVMLGLAFLGGLILNVMPCVLPVIALKILGFVNQSREEPRRIRQLGLIYGLGVLASFAVLAGMVIVVQQAGRAANWGMQFQNPQFLVGITVLVTLVSLNLFGIFEVNLAGSAMGAAGNLASREGAAGAFFNGVLATILATPCTAPFLAVALGFAFTQKSPFLVALMFLTVGVGLAFPYVLLSWSPRWLKFLPKPGVWMEKFKIAMGFPMLATAVWLLWLTTDHFGTDGTLWLGLFLVIIGCGAWIFGEFVQRGRSRKWLASGLTVALFLFGYFYVLEKELRWRSPELVVAESRPGTGRGGAIEWKQWSPEAVDSARNEGHPVFVDFTANWCLVCKLNKKRAIEIQPVQEKLKKIGAVALRGDHTKEDPRITEELRRYDRAGVPLVLVFPADRSKPAIVLPEILNPKTVLDALDEASQAHLASGNAPVRGN